MASLATESKDGATSTTMYKIGVVGCTGAVGKEIVNVLRDRGFPTNLASLRLFASPRSAGKPQAVPFGAPGCGPVEVVIEAFSVAAARECDFVFLAVSGTFALEHAEAMAAPGGAVVIDNSSAFRLHDAVPLIVPECNPGALGDARLIANPNCTTAIAAVALWPLHQVFGLRKVIVSSYQAASGAGVEGMEELKREMGVALAGGEAGCKVFTHPLAFNVIPHIDSFQDNGYTKEEMKVVWETRKIFGLPDLAVSCTAVRVPTLRAHAEAIVVETEKDVTPDQAREILAAAPGVEVVDDPAALVYPMPKDASTKYDVQAGRIRNSLIFGSKGLELFVCGDQLLKGAALNAVQIAEEVLKARA